MNFGQRLRKLREQKKITQKELSKLLQVSESAIGMYERGDREPNFETIDKIADYFNVQIDYLLGRSNDQTPGDSMNTNQTDNGEANIGRAFLGGADKYSEEELDLARAAAKAAVEAFRKVRQKNEDKQK